MGDTIQYCAFRISLQYSTVHTIQYCAFRMYSTVLHVYVSCRFLMGSLQLPLQCFCIIMLCVQLSLFIIYSACMEIHVHSTLAMKEVGRKRKQDI